MGWPILKIEPTRQNQPNPALVTVKFLNKQFTLLLIKNEKAPTFTSLVIAAFQMAN